MPTQPGSSHWKLNWMERPILHSAEQAGETPDASMRQFTWQIGEWLG